MGAWLRIHKLFKLLLACEVKAHVQDPFCPASSSHSRIGLFVQQGGAIGCVGTVEILNPGPVPAYVSSHLTFAI